MPIQKVQKRSHKEIKIYTLKRLLKRKQKYRGSLREAEDYEKLQSIFFAKNLNPFKILERGFLNETDLQEALNQLEAVGLINISEDNKLTLTPKGEKFTEGINHITNLNEINDDLLLTGVVAEEVKPEIPKVTLKPQEPPEPVDEEILEPEIFSQPTRPIEIEPFTSYTCVNCGNTITEPKNFCPKCGKVIELPMRCPTCGNPNETGSAFCIRCGTRLSYR